MAKHPSRRLVLDALKSVRVPPRSSSSAVGSELNLDRSYHKSDQHRYHNDIIAARFTASNSSFDDSFSTQYPQTPTRYIIAKLSLCDLKPTVEKYSLVTDG